MQQGRFGGETVPEWVESTLVLCVYFTHCLQIRCCLSLSPVTQLPLTGY